MSTFNFPKAESLSREQFANCFGKNFHLNLETEDDIQLELVEVTQKPHRAIKNKSFIRTAPFSLLFRGPVDILLPQHIYNLEHPTIGEIPLFLVSIDQDEHGIYYEALFN